MTGAKIQRGRETRSGTTTMHAAANTTAAAIPTAGRWKAKWKTHRWEEEVDVTSH
jgi:hypothetical protein